MSPFPPLAPLSSSRRHLLRATSYSRPAATSMHHHPRAVTTLLFVLSSSHCPPHATVCLSPLPSHATVPLMPPSSRCPPRAVILALFSSCCPLRAVLLALSFSRCPLHAVLLALSSLCCPPTPHSIFIPSSSIVSSRCVGHVAGGTCPVWRLFRRGSPHTRAISGYPDGRVRSRCDA